MGTVCKIASLLIVLGVSVSAAASCKVNDSDIDKKYIGKCVGGLAQGKGIAKGRDTYEGDFEKGNKHGKGVYTWSSGTKHDGDWQDDDMIGFGVRTTADGKEQVGLWLNGTFKVPCKSRNECEKSEQMLSKGIWSDSSTNLIWMRCSFGQKWTGKTCMGRPKQFQWQEALDFAAELNRDGGFAGHTDWRVPAIEELVTIRKCSSGWEREIVGYKATAGGKIAISGDIAVNTLPNGQSVQRRCALGSNRPALDTSIFPNMEYYDYWSSSPVASNGSSAWVVDFGNGLGDYNVMINGYCVRLVRSSQ